MSESKKLTNIAEAFFERRGITETASDILLKSNAGIDATKRIEGAPTRSIANIDQAFSTLRHL